MDMYRKAYEYYKEICENYEMDCVNFHHFIKHLTEEQLNEYSKSAG
jgi:hypothetical protein